MQEEVKNKILKIIVKIALVAAIFLGAWSIGRLILHDIPALVNGYEEIAVEYGEEENWMGVTNTTVTKTVKKKIDFESAMNGLISNFLAAIVCMGFIVVLIKPETLNKY